MSLRTDRKLSMQGLEQRQLMAGDVAAYVDGGTLFIEGDNAGNIVEVDQVGNRGEYLMLTGLGTDITDQNGNFSNGFFMLEGNAQQEAIDNIVINMKGGNDRVYFLDAGGSEFVGNISADMGSGTDTLSMQNWDVSEGLNAYNTFGLSVDISDSDFGSYLAMNATDIDLSNVGVALQNDAGYGAFLYGANTIDVDGMTTRSLDMGTRDFENTQFDANTVNLTDVNVVGDASFRGDIATDRIEVNNMAVGGSFDIDTYRINQPQEYTRDIVDLDNLWVGEDLNIHTGQDTRGDTITLRNATIGGSATMDAGNGTNTLTAENVDAAVDLWVVGGSGRDTVSLKNINLGDDLWLFTFGGNDAVTMNDVDAVDYLFADLGGGSDSLTLGAGSSARRLQLAGGNGRFETDSLSMSANSNFRSTSITGFENSTLLDNKGRAISTSLAKR